MTFCVVLLIVLVITFGGKAVAELRILLTYYQVNGLGEMKKDAVTAQWKQVLDGQKETPICSRWSAQ